MTSEHRKISLSGNCGFPWIATSSIISSSYYFLTCLLHLAHSRASYVVPHLSQSIAKRTDLFSGVFVCAAHPFKQCLLEPVAAQAHSSGWDSLKAFYSWLTYTTCNSINRWRSDNPRGSASSQDYYLCAWKSLRVYDVHMSSNYFYRIWLVGYSASAWEPEAL
jgi:hypothetical protein